MAPTSLARDLWDNDRPTRLIELPRLAQLAGVARVFVKFEGDRPLGNFKVLGGMAAGLKLLAKAAGVGSVRELLADHHQAGSLSRLVCASDGNHGLAVAAAAQLAGCRATVYLPRNVQLPRVARILAQGADVEWIEGTYDDAVTAARTAALSGRGILVPDTSEEADDADVHDVMAGYAVLTNEIRKQFNDEYFERPSHLFVQAGVGGLAAAMASGLYDFMQEPRANCVVEPANAACVAQALAVGRPTRIPGNLDTCAEMLSCGVASAVAIRILQSYNPVSVLVDEATLRTAVTTLSHAGGPATTPTGAAGLAGLLILAAQSTLDERHPLTTHSVVLLVATEGVVPV